MRNANSVGTGTLSPCAQSEPVITLPVRRNLGTREDVFCVAFWGQWNA